ncbi:hypothetical protein Tco_0131437 [Tanacetum coccineum]
MQISGENKPLVSSLMKEAEKPENIHSGLEAPRHLSFAFLSYHRSQNLHSTAASRPTVQRAFLFRVYTEHSDNILQPRQHQQQEV